MKKLILLTGSAICLVLTLSAQYTGDRDKYGDRSQAPQWQDRDRDYDNSYEEENGCKKSTGKNGRYKDYRTNSRYSNAPARVRDAFYRDFPRAGNVKWERDRGVWTAYFYQGRYSGIQSASYFSNGDRVGRNGNGGYVNSGYNNSLPLQVQRAFERDYPSASSVSWDRDSRIWTATFRSGLFGGTKTASYFENGERADNGTYPGNQSIPYRVQQSFERDYPNASSVSWAIAKGYYTATFRTGLLGTIRSATYDGNGNRV